MFQNYITKIINASELEKIYDKKIAQNPADIHIPEQKMRRMKDAIAGTKVFFGGFIDDELICEANATVSADDAHVQNKEYVLSGNTAYLSAFLTKEPYRQKGYFSKLYAFMENELRSMGFEHLTIGVEPEDEKNRLMYYKWGYTELIYSGVEEFDDMKIRVCYYRKNIK